MKAITFFAIQDGGSSNYLLQNPHCHVLNGGYQCQTTNMFKGKMALETKPAFFITNLTGTETGVDPAICVTSFYQNKFFHETVKFEG